jgi:uncharacterized protein YceH (UPF0502 family)
MSDNPETSIVFTPEEARILACLMEKQLTTPNNYPLTFNSLMLACNQKSNREPVMSLSEGDVGKVVNHLADKKLTRIEYGDRANKVFHAMRGSFSLNEKQQALLSVLMLRKPQTLNDLKTRTARMVEFEDNEELKESLTDLIEREDPLVILLPKGNGRREDRYSHLLCGDVIDDTPPTNTTSKTSTRNDHMQNLEKRIDELEARMEKLESLLSDH